MKGAMGMGLLTSYDWSVVNNHVPVAPL